MNEARRAELKARRTALLEETARLDRISRRAEYVRMVPILSALEDSGEAYDSHGYRALHGCFNEWAHDPRVYAMREHTHAKLPPDSVARNAVILARLGEHLGEGEPATVILRREELVLTLTLAVLARHLDTLFDNARSDWLAFVAPPADWIIATHHVDALELSQIVTGVLMEHP
ncbi:hypothetical protein HZY97_12480 [Sphingomonas sp. R-74633]|uniref:hypothetical protein n=1 Tax=Sphingomonas sp. R-74633 TaxID=2751188 RepID=UPI0015D289BF|nr:hypothetical protein [Sphingomonas sp. R-74633]NYT41580.1 hypothetical protein [Sphingomonas sp. R-74633]